MVSPRFSGKSSCFAGFDERPSRCEDLVQRRLGEELGRGVALARVVGAEQEIRPYPDLYPVAEGRSRTGGDVAKDLQGTERPVPGEGAEGDDDHQPPEARRRGGGPPPPLGNEPGAPPAADHLRIDLFEGFQSRTVSWGCGGFSTSAVENPPHLTDLAQLFPPMWTTGATKARSLKRGSRHRRARRKGLRNGVR